MSTTWTPATIKSTAIVLIALLSILTPMLFYVVNSEVAPCSAMASENKAEIRGLDKKLDKIIENQLLATWQRNNLIDKKCNK